MLTTALVILLLQFSYCVTIYLNNTLNNVLSSIFNQGPENIHLNLRNTLFLKSIDQTNFRILLPVRYCATNFNF